MLELSIILGVGFYIGALVYFVFWHYAKQHAKTKDKVSDAEVFKLMARSNHFMTSKQLAAVSNLTEKEAGQRLAHYAMSNIVRRYYDANGTSKSVYQLKDDVPLSNALPACIKGLSDTEILDIVLMHVADYQVTVPELVVIFGIDIYEAKDLIKQLKGAGLLVRLWKGGGLIYAIKKPLYSYPPKLKTPKQIQQIGGFDTPDDGRIKIPDADILQLAIDNNGRLTPTSVCLRLKIPMGLAKSRLEDLHEEGLFELDVDEENALITYQLIDKSLLED